MTALRWENSFMRNNQLFASVSLASGLTMLSPLAFGQGQVSGKFAPTDGSTLFFVGQTSPDLSDYKNQVLSDSSFPQPSGITLYTLNTCSGLDGSCGMNGNTMDFPSSFSEYPGADVNVGLYLSDSSSGCTNQPLRALAGHNDSDLGGGVKDQYRAELDTLVTFLRDSGRNIFLRIGYEFDGPWNCYNATIYKEAFRYVKGRIDALGATNIATVWHSASYPIDGDPAYDYDFSNSNHWNVWYPGDDVVDWVGISTFFFNGSINKYQAACTTITTMPETIYDNALNFARNKNKPVLIAESTPVAYRTSQLDASCILENSPTTLPNGVDELWDDWFDHYFTYIADNSDVIRGVAYINSDWEAIGQFNCAPGATVGSSNCTDGYWGNSRIQDQATIMSRFATALSSLGSSTSGGGSSGGGSSGGGSSGASGVFGIDSNGVLYHEDNGWTGNWAYLCLDGTCLQATLANGRYELPVTVSAGQSYTIEFKVQDNTTGQCLSGVQNITHASSGVTATSACD